MGKYQQSDRSLYPDGNASIIGVLLTGTILFFLSFLYPFQSENIWQSLGIFFAVLAIYFIDHYFDFKVIFGRKNKFTKLNRILAILFGSVTVVYVGLFWKLYFLNIQFMMGMIGLISYLLFCVLNKTHIRFLRELIIALTAAWIVCIKPNLNMEYFAFLSLGIVFFQNVLLFSFFEKELDVFWGFKNSFNTMQYSFKKTSIIYIQLCFLVMLIVAVYYFKLNYGLVYVSMSYVLLSIVAQKSKLKSYYRFLIDALLIGVLIP